LPLAGETGPTVTTHLIPSFGAPMTIDSELADAKTKLEKSLASLAHDFKHIRTGRASVAMIEHVQVEAYGAPLPIAQCASITVPEPTQIVVKPWDKSLLKAIEKALTEAQLGMNPQNDGQLIRLNVPQLSSERRQQLAAQAKDACEKCKVGMRTVRRDAIKHVETIGKAEKAPEDLIKKTSEKVSDLLKSYEAKAEAALADKVKDITQM
jgi:ribosome recycling factor